MTTIHTIPVPRGMTVMEAWYAIERGESLTDPEPQWANVLVPEVGFPRELPVDE